VKLLSVTSNRKAQCLINIYTNVVAVVVVIAAEIVVAYMYMLSSKPLQRSPIYNKVVIVVVVMVAATVVVYVYML
jgi:hypothetical protein